MMQNYKFVLLLPLVAATLGCSARHVNPAPSGQFAFAEKISIPGISDFGKVNDFLYRGAQPKDGGLEQLEQAIDERRARHALSLRSFHG
jgi:hypothetical protein